MSGDATFTTAPADGRPVRILVAGDSRGNAATWGQVLQAGAAEAPDLAIFTGDANDLGSIQDDWEAWFAAGQGVLEHLPLMMVHGNHEINSRHYYSQFPMPGNQQWYSFDFGPAHFTALNDTPPPGDPTSITSEQAPFLDADLGQTQQPWKLVTHHRPEYTSSTGHPPATDLQQAWESILDAHQVDLVLNGHAHAYERSHSLIAGQVVADGAGPGLRRRRRRRGRPVRRGAAGLHRLRAQELRLRHPRPDGADADGDGQEHRRHRHRQLLDHQVAARRPGVSGP